MKKQLLLNLSFLLFTISVFTQNSGTFSGTIDSASSPIIHSFVASGDGKYIFTGNYTNTSNGWVTPVAFIGEYNNYNIGGNFDADGILDFESNCVNSGETIGLRLEASGIHNYTVNYQFIPTTYSIDTEPNNTYSQAINTLENITYQGWFNNPDQPTDVDNTDWYKFTSPRDGDLVITLTSGDGYRGSIANPNLYNDLGTYIPASSSSISGSTNTLVYEDFNYDGNNFGIQITGNCVSYQLSWTINNSNVLSLEDYNLNNSIKLYPNPVLNKLKITSNSSINIEKVEIIGITGKLIEKTNFVNNSISIQNLNNGIYFIKIYSDKGIITKKIIKSE